MADRWWSTGWNWKKGGGSRQWDRPARPGKGSSSSAAAPAANASAAPAGSAGAGGSSELGPGTSSSQLRCAKYAKSVKNWKRGLQDRLKKYLAENGGWRDADISAFIQTDCNYAVYCANREKYEENCKRTGKPIVRRVREEKFLSVAIALQRCSLLGSRREIKLKEIEVVSDDKLWIAWREKHGIEQKADESSSSSEEEEPSASAEAAASSPVADPASESSDSQEPFARSKLPASKAESAQETALTKIAFVKIDGESDAEPPQPAPTTKAEVAVASAFSKLSKIEAEETSCGLGLKSLKGKWWKVKKTR